MFLLPSTNFAYQSRHYEQDDAERYERQTAHITKTMDAQRAKEQKQLRFQKAQRPK